MNDLRKAKTAFDDYLADVPSWFGTGDVTCAVRVCERCNSIESTGTVLKWYWDKDYNLHLLCEQCAKEINDERD
jgi:hypothetical protein